MSAKSILVKNAHVFDGHNNDLSASVSVLLAEGEIKEISASNIKEDGHLVIDAAGRTLMPGLIDNHIHVTIPTLDITALSRMPATYVAQYANVFLNATLLRGFTTIRDIGGGDVGIARAIAHGMVRGPRFYYAGKIMSQTGGHGDVRPGWEVEPSEQLCSCGSYSNKLATLVDSPWEMRRAVREELRKGSHCIKIMGSGGVASPNDPLHHTQFTEEEIRAAVDEASRQETYVSAHCHPAEAVRRCVEFGVRCIEHGTLIDKDTADYVAGTDAYVVPTCAVIHALHEEGAKYGLPPVSQEKIALVYEQAIDGLSIMRDAGVKLGFGTDLLGPQHVRQCTEFAIRKPVFSPFEILHQATAVNAAILMEAERLGCVREGAFADVLLVDGNPLEDISLLEKDGGALPVIIRNGEIVKCELPGREGTARTFSWPA